MLELIERIDVSNDRIVTLDGKECGKIEGVVLGLGKYVPPWEIAGAIKATLTSHDLLGSPDA